MNRTQAERYNKRLNEILEPEIKRMKKCEDTARNILSQLRTMTAIDTCGHEDCHLINIIAKEIRTVWYQLGDSPQ